LEGWAISTERSSKGRSFHADGPTIEKALRCIIAKQARGTKNSPLAAERSTRRAARTDTGQQRTRRKEGAQPRTQRETIAVMAYGLSPKNCEDFAKNHFMNVHGVDGQSLEASEHNLNII